LIALRIISDCIESGLLVVLLAFYQAIEDTREQWNGRR